MKPFMNFGSFAGNFRKLKESENKAAACAAKAVVNNIIPDDAAYPVATP